MAAMIAIMSRLMEMLTPLLGEEQVAAAGTTLFSRGDAVQYLHVVRQGCIHLSRVDPAGNTAVMQRAMPGNVVAESSIFSPSYHCDGVAVLDSATARASMPAVRAALAREPELVTAVACHLASEVQRARVRVEILARKTVRERLDAWLAFNGDGLPPHGTWRTVAEDINVTPEAFYRELKRRRGT